MNQSSSIFIYFTFVIIFLNSSNVFSTRDRNNKPYKVVCYFASWTNFFTAEDIDPHVCTHINYAFASLENNRLVAWNPKGLIKRLISLRKQNPNLTFLVSIGGWADGTDKYSEMVRSRANRKVFIRSVLEFLREHNFDGLDFDWEFPAFSGENREPGRAEDKKDLIRLFKELKETFRPQGYLLTAALTHSKYYIDRSYYIPLVNKYLDFINVMTYDYHGSWSRQVGHNSPLYTDPNASRDEQLENIEFTINYLIRKGANRRKLVLGAPLYSLKFRLANRRDYKVGAPAAKHFEGDIYAKVCHMVKPGNGWRVFWDNTAKVPYAVKGNEWMSYDNRRSMFWKVKYVRDRSLGGMMVWEVNGDDFKGHCGLGRFPLMNLIMSGLNRGVICHKGKCYRM